MDTNQKKRKSSAAPAAAISSKKRRKGSAVQGPKAGKPKRAITADALPWKTVDIPEMFDDAEGFFGLEEVQGVEVVRDGNTVKFVWPLHHRRFLRSLPATNVYAGDCCCS